MGNSRGFRVVVLVLVVAGALAGASPASAYQRPGRTERISAVGADGEESFTMSRYPDISADGRFVAFESNTAFVAGDTNNMADAYVWDRATRTMTRASVAHDGEESSEPVGNVQISGNGRYVMFSSDASNLVAGDRNRLSDIFVRDLQTGTTELVTVATDGTQSDAESDFYGAAPSEDGRYIAFSTAATTLVPGDTNGVSDVFLRDQVAGITKRISVSATGVQADGSSSSVALSATGRYATFYTAASNLGGSVLGGGVGVKDLQTGEFELASVSTDGAAGNGFAGAPDVSADGQRVVFVSAATNLVPNDTNEVWDIFVRDRAAKTTSRVTVGTDGSERRRGVSVPVISDNGRYVAYMDGAVNSAGGTANPVEVSVYDLDTRAYELVTPTHNGAPHNGFSWVPAISADGRYVAFESDVPNLVPGDFNGTLDVFVRDRGPDLGITSATATAADGAVDAAGEAIFSGAQLLAKSDPPADATNGAASAGGELTGLDVFYQAEQEALLFELDVASLPAPPAGPVRGGTGTVYTVGFQSGGTRYEVRGTRLGPNPAFALFNCTTACAQVRELGGGHGAGGRHVTIGVPLTAIGATEGSQLKSVSASTWLGVMTLGPLQAYDSLAAPDISLPAQTVRLAVTPRGAVPDGGAFTTAVVPTAGRWAAKVTAPGTGPHDLHARVCLGDTCSTTTMAVGGN